MPSIYHLTELAHYSLFSFQLCFTTKCTERVLIRTDFMPSGNSFSNYSRTPLMRINRDGQPIGYTESLGNWIFFENRVH
jgi:hypothetical protein